MRPLVFLALCVLSTPLFAGAAHASDVDIQAYAASDYDYCDAKVLASYWGEGVWEAKQRIGRKIGWGDQQTLDTMRREAGMAVLNAPAKQCAFYETGLTSTDAEALSTAWGISLSEAKATLARKASIAGTVQVRRDVLNGLTATQGGMIGGGGTNAGAGQLDKCHYKMLGHLWAKNQREVSAYVQQKVSAGNTGYVLSEVREARNLAQHSKRVACSFWDTPYTYADAQKLAARWGMSTSEAKSHVELKYVNGLEDWLAQEARAARGR